jgi:hypothetical protein
METPYSTRAHARGGFETGACGAVGFAENRRPEPKKNPHFSIDPSPAALPADVAAQHVHRPKIVALQRAVAW